MIVRRLLNALAGITAAYLPFMLVVRAFNWVEALSVVAFLFLLLALRLGMNKIGSAWIGAGLLVMLFLTDVWFISQVGLRAVQVANLGLLLVLASAFFRLRGVLAATLAASIAVGVSVFMEPAFVPDLFGEWLTTSAVLATIGLVLWWQAVALRHALANALLTRDALEEQERAYVELLRNAPDGVLSVSLTGVVESISPAVSTLTGYDEAELVGHRFWELGTLEHGSLEVVRSAFRQVAAGQPLDEGLVVQIHRKDGRPLFVESRPHLVRRQDGTLALHATVRDVSARERARRAREAYEAQLRKAERVELIGRLAGGVAHDFNNLLQVISANADFLAEEPSLAGSEALTDLTDAARRASRLTGQLLSLTRAQPADAGAVEMGEVFADLRSVLGSLIPATISLQIDVAPDTPRVRCDRTRLEQVIVNLVVNARDAMADGGALTITVERAEAEEGPHPPAVTWASIVVADTGRGIEPEHLGLVFEPFFTTKGEQGTGLGLASVRGIVEQVGGHIAVESALGEGARFTVVLPAGEQPEARPQASTASHSRGGTVLLVEDLPAVRRATTRCLERLGYRVVATGSVDHALEELAREVPDLVLTDVVMASRSGVELMREVRARTPGVPVAMMSAHAAAEGVEDADAFVQKPFTIQGLGDALGRALAEKVSP